MSSLTVNGAGFDPVNGIYHSQPHTSVPSKFDAVCRQQGWDTGEMWKKLNGRRDWYKHEENESYIYYNCSDNKWWIDGPDGLGVYITSPTPPAAVAKFYFKHTFFCFWGCGVLVEAESCDWLCSKCKPQLLTSNQKLQFMRH